MIIKLKYFPPLLIAAAEPDPSPWYLDNGSGSVDAHSPGADPFVPLGTQIMQ